MVNGFMKQVVNWTLLLVSCAFICSSTHDVIDQLAGGSVESRWIRSKNLHAWYTPLDLCIINSSLNSSHHAIIQGCEEKLLASEQQYKLQPMRCRAGNSWPSKSEFCSAEDLPLNRRENFFKAIRGYDDPSASPLRDFFRALAAEHGALLLIGDSVMQQFYGALACELEREKVWTNPGKFQNTDELQYVKVEGGDYATPVRFVPIYHMVNGRYDRIPHANMHRLKEVVSQWYKQHASLVVLINMGLHYVDNPVPSFTPKDYQQQMSMVLSYLNDFVEAHDASNSSLSSTETQTKKRVRVFWRETSAQHFPTSNGYWPGQRYANSMRLECAPVQDTTPAADWRNRIVEKVLAARKLDRIRVIKFYEATLPLYSEHPNGKLKDCTHFCWTPMLYQSIFHDMNQLMGSAG